MSLGLVVIIVMAILLVFHLVFYKLTQDDTNQFIIYGIFLCYSVCIILENGAAGIVMLSGPQEIVSQFLITVASILGVMYVSNLIDNRRFRYITFGIYAAALIILSVAFIMYKADIQSDFYYRAMFVLCAVSLFIYVIFLILCWHDIPGWYRILLCSMFFMVFCFTMLLLFDVLHISYAYYWAIGFIVYVVVYEAFSIWKLVEDMSLLRRMSLAAKEPAAPSEPLPEPTEIHWTRAELRILSEMGSGNTESKVIALTLDKSTSTIDTQIRTMLKKTGLASRLDLAKQYGIKQ